MLNQNSISIMILLIIVCLLPLIINIIYNKQNKFRGIITNPVSTNKSIEKPILNKNNR